MARSLFDQDLQIRPSASYDDAVSGANDATTAEGQTTLQGDLNVLRTLMSDLIGEANWFDSPTLSLKGVYDKQFVYLHEESGFADGTVTGTSTITFDTAISGISGHAEGVGSSTVSGVVVNSTKDHRLSLRDAGTKDVVSDGTGNEVYGRLGTDGTTYTVSFYSLQDGTQVAYSFAADSEIDLAYVAVSAKFNELPWDRFLDTSFHDLAGLVGSITDNDVITSGFTDLLLGLTSQAAVNNKVDGLGSTTNGEGAALVAVEDADSWFASSDVEAALNAAQAAIGGTAYNDFDFTENNVCTNDLSARANLEELDIKWGELFATDTANEGANLVGVQDSAGDFDASTVEGVLSELYGLFEDADAQKAVETNGSPISSGVSHTVPGSLSFTPAAGGLNMDVYFEGQMLYEGAGNDYTEDAGSPSTAIKFLFTVPANRQLSYLVRK